MVKHGLISPDRSNSEKWPHLIFIGLEITIKATGMATCLIAGVLESSLKDKAMRDFLLTLTVVYSR